MKRLLTLLLACSLLTLPLLLSACGGAGSSPEKVAEAYIKSAAAHDFDSWLDCYPDFYVDAMVKEAGVSSRSKLVKALKEKAEEDDDAESVKVTKVKTDEKYDKDDLEDVKDQLERLFDLDEKQLKKITSACEVTVTAKVDGEKEDLTLICIKYDGRWYVVN